MSTIEKVADLGTPHSVDDPEFQATVSAVVAAFGDPTRRDIYLFARDNEGVTANQVADKFSLHPNVARHHLDKLVSGGYLDVTLERPICGGAGRPSKRYKGAPGATSSNTVASKRDELLSMLLSAALELLDPTTAELMAESVGERYGSQLAQTMHPHLENRSIKYAIRTIADALSAHGFAAKPNQIRGSLSVINENCPFGDASLTNPVICALDRGLVRGMLGALIKEKVPITLTSRAKGDSSCSVSL